MATHSSGLAWKIPWTEEPGELQSLVLQRAGQGSATKPPQKTVVLCNKHKMRSLDIYSSPKASLTFCVSAFFMVPLSHPYMTNGKAIALTRLTFVGKVMPLLFNILSSLVITFLPRSKRLLISWLQSPSAVILEPLKIV